MGTSMLGSAILLTGANLVLRLFSIGFNVFLAGRIGAGGLGLLQLIGTVGAFAILIGSGGMRVAAMYLAAEEFGHRRLGGVRAAISACLKWGLILSAGAGLSLFLCAGPIACGWLRDSRATDSLQLLGLTLPFSCLCGVMTGYFTACARIRQLVAIEILERIFSMLLTAALLLFWADRDLGRSCLAITLGNSLGAAGSFLVLYRSYRRHVRHIRPEARGMGQRLFRLCLPLSLNDCLRSGLNTAEQLIIPYGLALYAGSTSQALADYGIIHAMVFPILMFPSAILYSVSDLLVPELSRSMAMGRRLRIVDLSGKCLRMTLLFAAGVAGFLYLGANDLAVLLYQSADAGHYLRQYAPLVLMLYLDAITDGLLKGLAEQVSCVRYNTFTSLLDVAFLLLLLPRWGLTGFTATFIVTHGINLALSLRRLLRKSRCRLPLSDILRPLLCLLPAVGLTSMLPTLPGLLPGLLLRGGYFLAVLGALYLLTGTLRSKDLRWLRSLIHKPVSSE